MCCNEFAVTDVARFVGGVKWEPSKKTIKVHYKLTRVCIGTRTTFEDHYRRNKT